MIKLRAVVLFLFLVVLLAGCQSPYYADRGALAGGLGGAGVGALVGNAVGNTGAGAVIGAGVGALSGAAIGGAMDEVEAKNRAMIEASMGRPLPPGVVTFEDVVAMTRAGVDEELIVNHIRANGAARPPQARDLIALQQQGVSRRVIETLQAPPQMAGPAPAPPPVIVHQPYYGPPPPPWGPYCYDPYPPPPPRFGWGVSYHGHHHH